MLRLSDIALDTRDFGDSFILTRISPDYTYLDGHRTSERIGTKYEVALKKLGYEKITIKVEGEQTIPEDIIETQDTVEVEFDDLTAHFYIIDNRVGVSAKAKQIGIKPKNKAVPANETASKKKIS